jgi:hypothetical protein
MPPLVIAVAALATLKMMKRKKFGQIDKDGDANHLA